jgi:DNA-binding transcriptional ArsR family regulator
MKPPTTRTAAVPGDAIGEVFAALADPSRRAIYEQLLAGSSMTATTLADGAAISRQAIVKHLQLLEAAGLAASARDGREVIYSPAPHGVTALTTWLEATTTRWQRRTDKLKSNTARR